MPALIALSLVVQLVCVVHCVRTGRNQLWIMVIIFFSLLGCFAYGAFEVMPEMLGRRGVRLAKAEAARRIDPERALRQAQAALETADTAANRIALADRLAELERWREAIPEYEAGLAKSPGPERGVQLRLARAQFEAGQAAQARSLLEALPETGSQSERDRAELLRGRVLEELGEEAQALAIYQDVSERMPGGEAQCRAAALLLKQGREGEARAALDEVARRVPRIDAYERQRDREMYEWAARTRAELEGK
jgi:hypothetical protein